jgi:alpha-mannosidase
MKDKTLHMIGNAHIDPVWLWRWQEGFHEVLASFRSALDRLREYEDFLFVSSSAVFYQWVEQNDPAMFEEIKARVAEGRWEIVGGWWLQPDCNIPSGESFVRHALYGQHYFKEKFGVTATVGYNVDSFGHHGMMPQLLKKSGLDSYVFMRPGPHEKGLPGRLFWWESDDGSRILTFRIPFEYCTWGKDLEQHVRRCAGELREPVNELMCFYGVGNHGGGPTKENIESIERLNREPTLPKLVFSTPEKYFATVKAKDWSLPVVHDDLQHHASGCYAAHSGVKQWNRKAEQVLVCAEKWSALAATLVQQPYPSDLGHAWKGVLFNQFHDILAGTSLERTYDDARDLYGEAMAIAARALNHATQALAWRIDIPEEAGVTPIVVFNPHAWPVKAQVEVEMRHIPDGMVLLDDTNESVPFQTLQSQATAQGRQSLAFRADLPGLGYRTYRLAPGKTVATSASTIKANELVLENDLLRLEFDPETGGILSLHDKEYDLEVFAGLAAKAVVLEDKSDTWSHNVFSFDKVLGTFNAKQFKVVEQGPVKTVLRVFSEYGRSSLVQDFTLYPDSRQIDVKATLNWQEQHKVLKLRFPVNVHFMRTTFEIPYGHIERFANGEEEPGQTWVDVSGTARDTGGLYGFSLLNDSKYSFDVRVRDIGMTVVRSPIYAHHDPMVPEADGHYSYIDQGLQTFRYSLLPHSGGWVEAETVKRAAELNQEPIALISTFHKGPLPQSASHVQVDSSSVLASVLKQAEEGNALILRLYETSKNSARAKITLPFLKRSFEAAFAPCEIKTFRIPLDGILPVSEVNLLEFEMEKKR